MFWIFHFWFDLKCAHSKDLRAYAAENQKTFRNTESWKLILSETIGLFTYDVSQQGQGGFLSQFYFFCVFGQSQIVFFLPMWEGGQISLFLGDVYVNDPYLCFQRHQELNNLENADQEFTDQDLKKD